MEELHYIRLKVGERQIMVWHKDLVAAGKYSATTNLQQAIYDLQIACYAAEYQPLETL